MDALTTLGLTLIAIAALGMAYCTALALLALEARLDARQRRHELALDLAQLVAEHAARPRPRARHAHHCPSCGRFARVTSTGPRGVYTRCSAHGMRLRATRRVGRPERHLVEVTAYRPLVAFDVGTETPALGISLPLRGADWLDGTEAPTLAALLAA